MRLGTNKKQGANVMQRDKELQRIIKWYEVGKISEQEYKKRMKREKKRQKKLEVSR